MHIVLIILYGLLLSIAVVKLPFFKNSRIKPVWLLAFFWLRVLAAWVHNFVAYKYYPNHGDIWWYFEESLFMKADLLKDPAVFYNNYIHFELGLGYIAFRFVSLVNMLLDFLSFNNFYINTLLFSFPAFLGSIALYRFFLNVFDGSVVCALTALILPSTLFFTACLHKDGILYALLGLFLYYWHKRAFIVCLLLLPLLAMRPMVLAGLVPALLLWEIRKRWLVALIMAVLLLAFSGPVFTALVERQKEFYELTGNSRIYLPALQPTWLSFMHTLPYAVINGFFQPLPGKGGQLVYTAFALELLLIWVLVAVAIFKKRLLSDFLIFAGVLVFIQLLLIGYIVPFVGAIVRYRSVFLPFLLAPALFKIAPKGLINKKIHI